MASSATAGHTEGSFSEIYAIVKNNNQSQYDLVYKVLLSKPEYLSTIPDDDDYSILHRIVLQGSDSFFNKVIAIPNLRFILLEKSASKPKRDILQIATENKGKSPSHKRLYQTINGIVQMDKFVEHGKMNQVDECQNMLRQDPDLANQKPPYRKFYLLHHLAYAGNKTAFEQLRKICDFDMKLLTSDQKTAAEVAFHEGHKEFGEYLESEAPEMLELRLKHEGEAEKRTQEQSKQNSIIEKQIRITAGEGMVNCFTCPLTREIFQDPVVASDGFTYERSAIQQWLDLGNRRSPMTNVELANITLVPNVILKQALSELYSKEKQ